MKPATSPLIADVELIRAYHARSKHRFAAYAEGPGQLDWDAQPAPFRHYVGAPRFELPLSGDRFERCYGQLPARPQNAIPLDRDSLGALLELSLGLSAWKSWGPNRWALRCNPSSGNLHPVEAYVYVSGIAGLPDGLHHYDPEQHALEGRALLPASPNQAGLVVALSSVMWREAWKYGERAFRYCQLDVGHAVGALAYAAALLGWEIRPQAADGISLAHLLGLDRAGDFPAGRYAFTENEEAEIFLSVLPRDDSPLLLPEMCRQALENAVWQGLPSRIDPAPAYRWTVIAQAAAATRQAVIRPEPLAFADLPELPMHKTTQGAASLIRQRRSAQRFDPKGRLAKTDFYRLLDALLPRPQLPWLAQEAPSRLHLLLFVLRVDGLPSGLYLMPRTPQAAEELPRLIGARNSELRIEAVASSDADCPAHLGLLRLAEMDLQALQRLARSLSCHQDIASTSAFSLGMLGEFERATANASGYRSLLREAGLLGQVLYLEAEAIGLRGTGIGCYFDDPVLEASGLSGSAYQSVYHFTVGLPVVDSRIETSPPYPHRSKDTHE